MGHNMFFAQNTIRGMNHEYGYLYNWYTINDARGIAPTGWRVPTKTDWDNLLIYIGGVNYGYTLKTVGEYDWVSPNLGATDQYGFSGSAYGFRWGRDGTFHYIGGIGIWFSSTSYSSQNAYPFALMYTTTQAYQDNPDGSYSNYKKRSGYAIRLIKENSTNDGSVTDIDGNIYPTVKIGDQVWMKKNLKTTRYNDKSNIPLVESDASWSSLSTGARCLYDNNIGYL